MPTLLTAREAPPTAPGTVSCLLVLEGRGRKGRGHVDTPVPGPSNQPQGNEVRTMQVRKRSKSLHSTMNHADVKCFICEGFPHLSHAVLDTAGARQSGRLAGETTGNYLKVKIKGKSTELIHRKQEMCMRH